MDGGEVEPLRAGDARAGDFFRGRGGGGEGFVEREADGLDRDVGAVGAFEKGSVCVGIEGFVRGGRTGCGCACGEALGGKLTCLNMRAGT